ncbi:RICIN domain-containing protein [Aquimarina agarivorans]|uniref:RICIN domain-containing protein n=1 Tax=Aquimarina agarivorans TaxID=980584 RepID=UPI000248FB32|nr:RICIN domain-containing protein [Aquimarina agarivorans]
MVILIISLFQLNLFAQRIGDEGMKFDNSKLDSAYPQMREWMNAGVEGGIPLLSKSKIKKTISATNSDGINRAIDEVSRNGGGQLRLRNGNYTINKTIFPKNNVRIVGESRDGVVMTITMTGKKGEAIYFRGVKKASLERLTIKGNQSGTPDPFKLALTKPNYDIKGIVFGSGAKNCWVDKVTVLNTGGSPVNTWKTDHLTFRDMYVDGVWNKGGGGSGYFALQSGYALVYNCTIKNLRHFAIQREGAYYNVVYKNNITQDVNFHNADAGNNLIEQNNITIQAGLERPYHAVMGPWASFHRVSDRDNYIYKNTCIERNNNNRRSFSDNNTVYLGPRRKEEGSRIPEYPFNKSKKTPKHGTFYPAIENGNNTPPVVTTPKPKPAPTPKPTTPNPVNSNKPTLSFVGIKNGKLSVKEGANIDVEVKVSVKGSSINNVKLYLNNKLIRQENKAPYQWEYKKDTPLKNLKKGNYTIKAVATDNKNATNELTFSLKVGNTTPKPTNLGVVDGNIQMNGTYYIKNKSNDQNIIAPKWDDYNTRMYNARTFNDQKWVFKHLGNGVHTIKNTDSNRYLEVLFGKCENGSNIATWTNANSDHQKWILTRKNGNIFLRPKHCANKALDKRGGNDQNVHLWAHNTSNVNQQFELIPVNGAKALDDLTHVGIKLFPNPAIETLNLNLENYTDQAISYTITSMLGQIILKGDFDKSHGATGSISVNPLSNGMYFIAIKTRNGLHAVDKFMISGE